MKLFKSENQLQINSAPLSRRSKYSPGPSPRGFSSSLNTPAVASPPVHRFKRHLKSNALPFQFQFRTRFYTYNRSVATKTHLRVFTKCITTHSGKNNRSPFIFGIDLHYSSIINAQGFHLLNTSHVSISICNRHPYQTLSLPFLPFYPQVHFVSFSNFSPQHMQSS